jgi:hypothetical protein
MVLVVKKDSEQSGHQSLVMDDLKEKVQNAHILHNS